MLSRWGRVDLMFRMRSVRILLILVVGAWDTLYYRIYLY